MKNGVGACRNSHEDLRVFFVDFAADSRGLSALFYAKLSAEASQEANPERS
jgi:hypothetical protein